MVASMHCHLSPTVEEIVWKFFLAKCVSASLLAEILTPTDMYNNCVFSWLIDTHWWGGRFFGHAWQMLVQLYRKSALKYLFYASFFFKLAARQKCWQWVYTELCDRLILSLFSWRDMCTHIQIHHNLTSCTFRWYICNFFSWKDFQKLVMCFSARASSTWHNLTSCTVKWIIRNFFSWKDFQKLVICVHCARASTTWK